MIHIEVPGTPVTKEKFMSIREASAVYEVSRAKLHRRVKTGRLHSEKNPRDERVTLLSTDDLEALFQAPGENVREMSYGNMENRIEEAGRLTAGARARVDALRSWSNWPKRTLASSWMRPQR